MSANREQIRQRIERARTMLVAEPQGVVSKPHICWATDALSQALRDLDALLGEKEPT